MKNILKATLAVIVSAFVFSGCSENVSSDSISSSTVTKTVSSAGASSASTHNYNVENEFGLELPNTRAGEFAAKALAADTWCDMIMLGTDEELAVHVSDTLSFDMLEDSCFIITSVSGRRLLAFIAKPKAENDDTVNGIFKWIFHNYMNDPDAGYTAQEKEDSAGAVSGVTGNGYYYLVVHKNGAQIADAMVG